MEKIQKPLESLEKSFENSGEEFSELTNIFKHITEAFSKILFISQTFLRKLIRRFYVGYFNPMGLSFLLTLFIGDNLLLPLLNLMT